MKRNTDDGPAVLPRLERADVQSVEEVVTTALREAILSGDLLPGEPLPQEQLADQLRVSRIPLRDALRRLEAEGLVRFGPRRGAHVAALGPDDVREIYELRILLEERTMRRAVEALDDAAIQKLVAMSERMDALTGDPAEGRRARRDFYSALYAYARRPRSHKLIVGLRDEVQRYHVIKSVEVSRSDHAELRECIKAKDGERAARLQREHLTRACNDLVEVLEREASA
jgi:DNA-binding GntR family transcriptional regulator